MEGGDRLEPRRYMTQGTNRMRRCKRISLIPVDSNARHLRLRGLQLQFQSKSSWARIFSSLRSVDADPAEASQRRLSDRSMLHLALRNTAPENAAYRAVPDAVFRDVRYK
eukprot:5056284-Pyramimonas_sp.AAC.1